jgi:hypothetical protein
LVRSAAKNLAMIGRYLRKKKLDKTARRAYNM